MVTHPQINMFHRACDRVRCYRGLISLVHWGQRTLVYIILYNFELWEQGGLYLMKMT